MAGMAEQPSWTGQAPPLPPPPTPPPGRRAWAIVAAVLAAVIFVALGAGIGWQIDSGSRATRVRQPVASPGRGGVFPPGTLPTLPPSTAPGATPSEGSSAASAAARVTPAIVDVNTYVRTSYVPGSSSQRALGAGTGIVLTSSGEVLTNNHVVRGATSIRVSISGHGTFSAKVVGVDTANDVALIQLRGATDLPTVTFGDPSALQVGQQIVAIGNALGKGGAPTSTVGSVTGLDRSITAHDQQGGAEHLQGLIQTDALIRPGDSGGALANTSGQVIGLITAGRQSTEPTRGSTVGFAIPTDGALAIADQIRTGTTSGSIIVGPTGFLGVQVADPAAGAAGPAAGRTTSGALVVGVVQGTPAAKAIPPSVVITAVDGVKVSSAASLGDVLHQHRPGDVVTVTWVGASTTKTVSVKLRGGGPAV
jgi:S1-C subfamily serine protease